MTTQTLTRREGSDVQQVQQEVFRLPRVNISETENTYVIEAEMPGVAGDAIDVRVEDHTLTLEGRRTQPQGAQLLGHRVDGYRRAFTLGEGIDHERIEASAKHGILRVTLHKVPSRVPRKIEVKVD